MFNLLSLLAFTALLVFGLAGICLCYAIVADANARGGNGSRWGFYTVVFLPGAVPAYLLHRRSLPRRTEPAGRLERVAGSYGIGVAAGGFVGAMVSPPDPFSMILYAVPLIVVFVPAAFVCCYEPGCRTLLA